MTAPTVSAVPMIITEPGLYDDLPEDLYHSDPVPEGSLSSTGAKEILKCPAKFAYYREHGRPDRKSLDLGKVFHSIVLGTGAEYVALPYDDWTTKAAKGARDEARAAGLTPLKTPEWDQVQAMVAAFRASPLAALLPPEGHAEQSMFWRDAETGVWCRGRLDWGFGFGATDVKTAEDASRAAFARAVATYGYHIQDVLYRRGMRTLGLAGDYEPTFTFAVIEKTPPYLTATYELNDVARATGEALVSRALRRYAECQRTGIYPGYPDDFALALPGYATYLPDEDDYS